MFKEGSSDLDNPNNAQRDLPDSYAGQWNQGGKGQKKDGWEYDGSNPFG